MIEVNKKKLHESSSTYDMNCKLVFTLSKFILLAFIFNGVFISILIAIVELAVFFSENYWLDFSSPLIDVINSATKIETIKFILSYSKFVPFIFSSVVIGLVAAISFWIVGRALVLTIFGLKRLLAPLLVADR
jgi:cell division protein FtsX